jgi:hypothetical protein
MKKIGLLSLKLSLYAINEQWTHSNYFKFVLYFENYTYHNHIYGAMFR